MGNFDAVGPGGQRPSRSGPRRDPTPMRWSNVFVIFRREVRDQVRDRRTLFMIFVLPILLYPILGIGIVQFWGAFEQTPRTVLAVGAESLPAVPPLLTPQKDTFDPTL